MANLKTGRWNINALEKVDEQVYDRVWKLFSFIGEQESHFNNLQAKYRTLASAWLLAAFSAMGFVVSTKISIDVAPTELIVAAIAAAGAIGIWLLWIVDILVYHRLLDACFIEGLKLEKSCHWMPRFRHNMMNMLQGEGVLTNIVGFYLGPIMLFVIVAGSSVSLWANESHGWREAVVVVAVSGVVALAVAWSIVSKTKNTRKFIELLEAEDEKLQG